MNFNSGIFLIYLPVTVIGFWLLPHKARKYWLLAASCFFYMYWNPTLILLLALSTVIDYSCGRGMEHFREDKAKRKALLLVSVFMNLGILFFFKYFNFFSSNVNSLCELLSIPYRVPKWDLILPVGISFYTFQTMSYSIDVYRGDYKAEKDFITFALYVSFFPQLVAGPIESPGNLMPQLKAERKFSYDDFIVGGRQLLCGFFRKCVVADLCGIYVNSVYDNIAGANALSVLLVGGLFCFQMYCDFAGYSEIATGCARMMGVRLMRNFDRPCLSQSYGEFFRRWHISLNRWFTSYVYIPLGGGRKGLAVKMRNTIIVFALCGLWHGARWTYVVWGLYAAFFLCLETLLKKPAAAAVEKLHIPLAHPLVKLFRRSYMFLIYIPSAIIFRSESMTEAFALFARFFDFNWSLDTALTSLSLNSASIVGLCLTLLAMTAIYSWGNYDPAPAKNETVAARRTVTAVFLILTIALSWLALLASADAAGFAYFQF